MEHKFSSKFCFRLIFYEIIRYENKPIEYTMIRKISIFLILVIASPNIFSGTGANTAVLKTASSIDLSKFVKEVYDLYQTSEVPVKQERFVYKKLSGLFTGSYTMKITCSDSIAYDKKEDKTTIKSQEVYYADNKNGYFGVFVIVTKSGDDLLLNSSPDKEITISGTVTEILVLQYRKGMDYFKCRTSLKDFDDSGTVIQQILIYVQA